MDARTKCARTYRVEILLCAFVLGGGCASNPGRNHTSFEGAWATEWCDPADPNRECGFFQLYLTQERDRICGGHSAGTVGLGRMDEGDYDSVKGTVAGRTATLVIVNGRTLSTHLATATLEHGRLHWKMVGQLTDGISDEPAIIPVRQTLDRATEGYPLQELARIQRIPCRWPDEDRRPFCERKSDQGMEFMREAAECDDPLP